MEIDLQPGKYIVAVSGGVDSMVLLDMLRQIPDLDLIVAHFNHGIRPDSAIDSRLVQDVAHKHGLIFLNGEGKLGIRASESTARDARYKFLRRLMEEHQADAIVTAHHQDDALETAIINLLRGTGRKGLSSLRSTAAIKRPLLTIPKQQLREYAAAQALVWREDSTNMDESYLRNYVRHRIVPRLSELQKAQLHAIITQSAATNDAIDTELLNLLPAGGQNLPRKEILKLSHAESRELMAAWLRSNGLRDFDRPMLERLVVAAKTAMPGKRVDVIKRTIMHINPGDLALEHIER